MVDKLSIYQSFVPLRKHEKYTPVHAPCTEHDWTTSKYRVDIHNGVTMDIALRVCDSCQSVILTQRSMRTFVQELNRKIDWIVKKERRGLTVFCRMKRKVGNVVNRLFCWNPFPSPGLTQRDRDDLIIKNLPAA